SAESVTPIESASKSAEQPVKASSKGKASVLGQKPSMERQLNDAWYNRGSIQDSYQILQLLGAETSELSEKGLILKQRVEGAYRLFNSTLEVPPRTHGCVYTPESGRVMYTVHSTPIFNSN